jgi:putative membrane protein
MWRDHGEWGWGDWLGMSLMMLVFWALLVVLVVWLVRGFRRETTRAGAERRPPTEQAEQLLAERFARGEIDAEEFERRRKVLEGR